MSNYLEHPLIIQGTQEQTADPLVPARFLPSPANFANDEKVQMQFQEMREIVDETRRNRLVMEQEWEGIRNMSTMTHDTGRRYFGRSDVYLPIYRRERSKLVSTLSSGLFPSDDYFDVTDMGTGDVESARTVKAYMQWEIERNARLRSQMKPWISQLVDFGTSPLKYWYKKDIVSEGKAVRKSLAGLLGAEVPDLEYSFNKCYQEGMAVSTRNLMFWYIYPETAGSIEEAEMIFEDCDVPLSFVHRMRDTNRWVNTEQVEFGREIPEHERALQQLLSAKTRGMDTPGRNLRGLGQRLTFTEIWSFMHLPRSAYMDYEDPRFPVPVQIHCVEDVVLMVRRNPFFHQRPPYVVARMDWEAGFFYGSASGRTIRPLQMLANDFMNQTNDNGIMAMNPITMINPSMMVGKPKPFSPGVPWYVLDVDKAVRFERPPMEQVPMGVQMSQLVIGLAQDSGGAPPDRGTMSKGAKTATGMQILQKNALSPLQDVVEDMEMDALIPLLWGAFKNAIQYRNQSVMVLAAGKPVNVNPEQLAIDAAFRWLASSQSSNNQVRTQQAMALIQAVLPLVPILMQQGYIVDFSGLVKRVYSDGLGFRNVDDFIKKAAAVPGAMPGQPIDPAMMPNVQAEQEDRYRSALEQVPGNGQVEAVPGEAEEFSNVRQEADDLAGILGSLNAEEMS
jgi:hypothetical protein